MRAAYLLVCVYLVIATSKSSGSVLTVRLSFSVSGWVLLNGDQTNDKFSRCLQWMMEPSDMRQHVGSAAFSVSGHQTAVSHRQSAERPL